MGFLLGPVVLAIIGSLVAGRGDQAQLVGAAVGLVIGMGGAVVVARLLRARSEGA